MSAGRGYPFADLWAVEGSWEETEGGDQVEIIFGKGVVREQFEFFQGHGAFERAGETQAVESGEPDVLGGLVALVAMPLTEFGHDG